MSVQNEAILHVATKIQKNPGDPDGPIEAVAIFVADPLTLDKKQDVYFVKKAPLETLLRLTDIAEMLGYNMPVSSVSFTEALGALHATETLGRPVQYMILDLDYPQNTMNRLVPTA